MRFTGGPPWATEKSRLQKSYSAQAGGPFSNGILCPCNFVKGPCLRPHMAADTDEVEEL